jgi:DSF synthase
MALVNNLIDDLPRVDGALPWAQQSTQLGYPKLDTTDSGVGAFELRRPATARRGGRIDPSELAFSELEIRYEEQDRIFWQFMRPDGRPSYTLGLLRDMRQALQCIDRLFAEADSAGDQPINYVVLASRMPGIFNLGGDLPLFVDLIRAGNSEALRSYAHACIDVQFPRAINVGRPYIGISLVQGDALGGGFEAALADDIIIAERSAKFGLPEILFNLFPGMGAYSFLSRRLDPVRAERMILSGRIYEAAELHAMGIVDELAEDGQGEGAVYDYVARNRRSFQARRALCEARRIARPLTREELITITDLWVETALTLAPQDVRKMERLAAAQDRRHSS